MKVQTRPVGGRVEPRRSAPHPGAPNIQAAAPATTSTLDEDADAGFRNDDIATMQADIAQARAAALPPRPALVPQIPLRSAPTPPDGPPHEPEKPSPGWLGSHLGLEGLEHWLHEHAGLLALKSEAQQVTSDAIDTALHPVSRTGSQLTSLKTETGRVASDAAETALQPVSNSGAHLSHLSGGMTLAAGGLGVASGALGVFLLRNGARDVRDGLAHRDLGHTAEGVGSLVVGTRSLAAGAAMLGHLAPDSSFLHAVGSGAGSLIQPLGLIHGAIDTGLGVRDVVQGIQQQNRSQLIQGGLGIGVGASLMAAAAGGGVPALVSAGAFLAGRVLHDLSCSPKDH